MNNQPKIRFKGYEDDWVQRKLGDVSKINPNSKIPSEFNYVNLENVVGTELISYTIERRDTAPSRAQRLAKKGDIFYQTVRPYQNNNYIFEKDIENFVFSTGYAQIRPEIDNYFLFTCLQKNTFINNVLNHCTGTSYPAINSTDLAQININITQNAKEQVKVGDLFRLLDNTIALHQGKKTYLTYLKQNVISKIYFNISAKNASYSFYKKDWNKKTLDSILTKNKKKNKNLEVTNIESISNKKGFVSQKLQFEDYIVASEDISKYTVVDVGQFGYNPSRINVGSIAYKDVTQSTSIISPLYISFSVNNELYDKFLIEWFNTDQFESQRKYLSEGGVRETLSFEALTKMTINYPQRNEQLKIVNLLKYLSDIIEIQNIKLELLESLKSNIVNKILI